MEGGGMIAGRIQTFPKEERRILDTQNIYSLAVVPIFVGKDWWGFIGFNECTMDRDWAPGVKDALKTAAGMLGAAIQHNQVMTELTSYREHLEDLVAERTSELHALNEKLRKEIIERKEVEKRITRSLKEKEVLLQEVHHRTKNNMQVISGLLTLQAGCIEDQQILSIFEETQTRIRSMALVHEKLYQSSNLYEIEVKDYIEDLAQTLIENHRVKNRNILLKLDIESLILSIDTAIPCGLVINEALTNAFKYAFPGTRGGEINITLHALEENEVELTIRDNGVGMPKDLDFMSAESLGLVLIKNLVVDQLQGTVELRTDEEGMELHIRFKHLKKGKGV
jgi:two-component sensor histidine kinase